MEKEYTFVMVRPGAIRRRLFSNIVNRIKEEELKIEFHTAGIVTKEQISEHYVHVKDSYPEAYRLMEIEMLSGCSIFMIVSGESAISKMRHMIGPREVIKAQKERPDSIRALGNPDNTVDNLIHASDSMESARIEIKRFLGIDIEEIDKNQINKILWKSKKRENRYGK